MTVDPVTPFFFLPSQDLGQLRTRAAAAVSRSQGLYEVSRAAQAHAASLCAESAMLVDEVCFRQSILR
jgi:hypothetical protein